MNATSILPSLLKILLDLISIDDDDDLGSNFIQQHFGISNRRHHRVLVLGANIMAFLMQLSATAVAIFSDYSDNCLKWNIPVAIFLVSISFMFNYLTIRKTEMALLNRIKNVKLSIERSKHKIGLVTNVWKIGIILLFSQIFYPNRFSNISLFTAESAGANFSNITSIGLVPTDIDRFYYFVPFIVHVSASITFYLASSLAYKLRMIRFSFALPLTLLTPVLYACAVLICELGVENGHKWLSWFPFDFKCERVSSLEWYSACGLCLWWISHLWTTRHVWQRTAHSLKNTTIKR
jgi:hypothetical protein